MARMAIFLANLLNRARTEKLPQWAIEAFEHLYKETYKEAYKDGQQDALERLD